MVDKRPAFCLPAQCGPDTSWEEDVGKACSSSPLSSQARCRGMQAVIYDFGFPKWGTVSGQGAGKGAELEWRSFLQGRAAVPVPSQACSVPADQVPWQVYSSRAFSQEWPEGPRPWEKHRRAG